MTFQLYTEVALNKDLPHYGFCKGDIGTIVEYYPGTNNQEAGYSLEMLNATGEVLKVITVSESSLRQLSRYSVLSVRELAPTG
jgi:hypothetical protein